MASKAFRGEIWTNVDNRVLEAIVKANEQTVDGCVGNDYYSLHAIELVQKYFKDKIYATFTVNGTGANMIALKAMLDRYSSIICAKETHVNVYEAGAFEYTLGNKILYCDAPDGKLTVKSIERLLENTKKYKYIPKVIVITEPTEFGTLYSLEELKSICDFAHENEMYVYVDGARIATAITALDTDLCEMIEKTGVDVFTIGGTKLGAMFGEMVVFRHAEFARHLDYLQKQSFQHFDKLKFLGVQLNFLLESGIWLENAEKANKNAKLLEQKFLQKGISAYYPVETNAVFVPLSEKQVEQISAEFDLHYWNVELQTVRFITTADTTEDSMQKLVDLI